MALYYNLMVKPFRCGIRCCLALMQALEYCRFAGGDRQAQSLVDPINGNALSQF